MSDPTEIAIAVVEFDGKFLIGLRPEGAPLADYWEFPGGKVEPGETPQETAARECREETGIEVFVREEYPEVVHQYDHDKLRLHFFKASPSEFALPTNERFQWVPREQLSDYQFPDANNALLELLRGSTDTHERDFKFWLGPVYTLTVLVFIGLLITDDIHSGVARQLAIGAVGAAILGMSVLNRNLSRDSWFNLCQVFFDVTALCVTWVFAQVVGWAAFLVWVPLVLLRRL